MTTEAWIALAGMAAGISSILGGFFYLGRRIGQFESRLEHRFAGLESRLDALTTWMGSSFRALDTLLALIVGMLTGRLYLTDAEKLELQKAYAGLHSATIDAFLEQEKRSHNPLTPEQWQRLRAYIDKARAGQPFTLEEVQDYNRLVSILERERPTDPGVWPLVALGAFLLGLVIGTQAKPGQ